MIIVYPHTSNWDFVIGYLARLAAAIPIQFVGKHTLFRWPFGGLLRRMGGIPVNRTDPAGLVERLAGELARGDRLWLALAPEGTRSYTDHWKSGFYRLALEAKVPVGLGFIDYRGRTVGLTTYLSLSCDEEADSRAHTDRLRRQGRQAPRAGERHPVPAGAKTLSASPGRWGSPPEGGDAGARRRYSRCERPVSPRKEGIMKRPVQFMALLSVLVPIAVFAQAPSSAEPSTPGGASDPMAGWTPPKKLTPAQDKKARQEILALFKKMEQAAQKGELDSAVALVDFPVLMVTDTKAGDAVGGPWTEEMWRKVMTPFYEHPMKDMRVTHNPKVFLVTEALASVDDDWTMTVGKKKTTGRSSNLLVRKGGEWKVKAMVEGGWGDMPMPDMPAEGGAPGQQGTGAMPAEPRACDARATRGARDARAEAGWRHRHEVTGRIDAAGAATERPRTRLRR